MPAKKYNTEEERYQAKLANQRRHYELNRERLLAEKKSKYDPANTSYKRNPERGRELWRKKAPYLAETRLFRGIEMDRLYKVSTLTPEQKYQRHLLAMRNYINRRTEIRRLCAMEIN